MLKPIFITKPKHLISIKPDGPFQPSLNDSLNDNMLTVVCRLDQMSTRIR